MAQQQLLRLTNFSALDFLYSSSSSLSRFRFLSFRSFLLLLSLPMLSTQSHDALMQCNREVPLDRAYQTYTVYGRTNQRTCALERTGHAVTDQAVTSP